MYLTKAQRKAVHKVWLRICEFESKKYQEFRRQVMPGPNCIMVPFAGMWLGIEPDGHTHS